MAHFIDSYDYRREQSPLHNKSFAFSVRVCKMIKYIHVSRPEEPLVSQLVRASTAIGALVREAEFAQSPADFINKLTIALKEGNETLYWIHVFFSLGYIKQEWFESLTQDCQELVAMLVSSIKTVKKRNPKQ